MKLEFNRNHGKWFVKDVLRAIDRYGLNVIGAMSAVCAVFVVICLVSFIQTRRRKAASDPDRSVSSISIVDTVLEDEQVPDVKPPKSA